MPFYKVEIAAGTLTRDEKQQIAAMIPQAHHEATNAPPNLVNVLFYELASEERFLAGKVGAQTPIITCGIRGGKGDLELRALLTAINAGWQKITENRFPHLIVLIDDRRARITMESGFFIPEHGDEEAWLREITAAGLAQ